MQPHDIQFIRENLPAIYNFVHRLCGNSEDANDITQEVFIKAWKNLKKVEGDRPIRPWLFTIARNTTIDWLRKKRHDTFSSLDRGADEFSDGESSLPSFESKLADNTPLADSLYENAEIADFLEQALNKLSLEQRTIVILHDTEELTFEEIALIVEAPMNTVKSQYRRAILILRKIIENDKNAPKTQ